MGAAQIRSHRHAACDERATGRLGHRRPVCPVHGWGVLAPDQTNGTGKVCSDQLGWLEPSMYGKMPFKDGLGMESMRYLEIVHGGMSSTKGF